jgi:hypothetical protein
MAVLRARCDRAEVAAAAAPTAGGAPPSLAQAGPKPSWTRGASSRLLQGAAEEPPPPPPWALATAKSSSGQLGLGRGSSVSGAI